MVRRFALPLMTGLLALAAFFGSFAIVSPVLAVDYCEEGSTCGLADQTCERTRCGSNDCECVKSIGGDYCDCVIESSGSGGGGGGFEEGNDDVEN